MSLKQTPAWKALDAHLSTMKAVTTVDLFASDAQRFDKFHTRVDDILFDFSKHRVTQETIGLLVDLAKAAKLEERRAALFAGEPINVTEHRSVLHMALRSFGDKPILSGGADVMPEVREVRGRMLAFADAIRGGTIKAANGQRFTDIVNIGIGGSDLGPAMAARALSPFVPDHLSLHFVSNVDGADLGDTLKHLQLETTLFIICSKTFTTQETMTNAASARAAIAKKLGEKAVADHFCAVSTQLDKIAAFGIKSDRVFGFWDWVGGRYSVWSSIGLSVAIGIGAQNFEEFLRGGEDIDTHFVETPLERNVPVLMGLLGIWYHDFFGFATQGVIPYDQRLGRFSAYLQQLDMESNGKSVQLSGERVVAMTAPIIWGEPGTNGQHAFFQMLHQGTEIVPLDFMIAANPTKADRKHHELLMANCLAQGEAMMRGRPLAEVKGLLRKQGLKPDEIEKLAPHKVFDGNRPTSTFVYPALTPRLLGRLIALYEHKIFVQGTIWNINSFDQWGVELGKELANRLAPIVADPQQSTAMLDSSTGGLIGEIRRLTR